MKQILLLTCFLQFLGFSDLFATFYVSNNTGAWSNPSTWLPVGIPGPADSVRIDGHTVIYDNSAGNVLIKHLEITNFSNNWDTYFILTGDSTFSVLNDLVGTAYNYNSEVELRIQGNVIFDVGQDLYFERKIDNTKNMKLKIFLFGNAQLNVGNDFTFDFHRSNSGEGDNEIEMNGNAILTVLGNTYLNHGIGGPMSWSLASAAQVLLNGNLTVSKSSGKKLSICSNSSATNFQVNGNLSASNASVTDSIVLGGESNSGKMIINGNLEVNSLVTGAKTVFNASGLGAKLEVKGDINLSATGPGDSKILIKNNATLKLAGTINRNNSFGLLVMDNSALFELNGTDSQVIPSSKLTGSGTDSLKITNIKFNNVSGMPMSLNGPLIISNYLELSAGILVTTPTNTLTILDGAGISPGSPTAYIDGPITKQGSTGGTSFVFPTGDGNTYAPIEISAMSNADAEFTAEFLSDPPPWGNLTGGLDNVSTKQYWRVQRNIESDGVDITLHWQDADALGIYDLASLRVVSLDSSDDWLNHGNSASSGASGAGSITSSDPPPWGNMEITLGSVSSGNSLPAELTKFEAMQKENQVQISWHVISQVNTNHFLVERSADGYLFSEIDEVLRKGEEEDLVKYNSYDHNPLYGTNYYRLKTIDKDGSYAYSNVAVVDFDKKPELSVYPNPVEKTIHIEGTDNHSNEIFIEVYDRNSQLLYSGNVKGGNRSFQVNTNDIEVYDSGIYFLRIVESNRSQLVRFIKVH